MPLEKTFHAAEAEPRLTAKWLETGAFRAGANKSRDDSFTIMIPPPNVTGALHVGHAFNNTLQDTPMAIAKPSNRTSGVTEAVYVNVKVSAP